MKTDTFLSFLLATSLVSIPSLGSECSDSAISDMEKQLCYFSENPDSYEHMMRSNRIGLRPMEDDVKSYRFFIRKYSIGDIVSTPHESFVQVTWVDTLDEDGSCLYPDQALEKVTFEIVGFYYHRSVDPHDLSDYVEAPYVAGIVRGIPGNRGGTQCRNGQTVIIPMAALTSMAAWINPVIN